MKTRSELIHSEYDSLQGGQVALFLYRLSNLCLKADGAALLPVEVFDGDNFVGLEEVADVTLPSEDRFCIIPKSHSFIRAITMGVFKIHPELKMSIKKLTDNGFEDVEGMEDDSDDSSLVILAVVPEVNRSRYDAVKESIKILYNDCKTKMEDYDAKYTLRLTNSLEGEPADYVDEMRKKLKDTRDSYAKMRDEMKETKLKELEDAYERYQANEAEKKAKQQEEENATNSEVGLSMNMGEWED